MSDNTVSEFSVSTEMNDGIERKIYRPKTKRYQTPILFLHGMWHGAWCWQHWQQIFAEQGWESHAISLPGHGESPVQRNVRFCTMGYYLQFLKREIDRMPVKPIVVGHSMGGALTQWYLKKESDDLPATVLVAPWTSHSTWFDGMSLHFKRDPLGILLVGLTFSTDPLIRNAERSASMLITEDALYSKAELHSLLDRESAVVLNQHNPPFWKPKQNIKTPMLWLGAENDAVISLKGARNSAAYYGADFLCIKEAGHNLMMERSYRDTASKVDKWLAKTVSI